MEHQNSCENGAQIAVLMVPFPVQGHLNPLLHLSHSLISYKIAVHFAGSATHNCQAKLRLHGWDPENSSNIHFHDFELPLSSSLLPVPDPTNHFPVHMHPLMDALPHFRQPVYHLLCELAPKFKRIVVIHDSLMASVVQDVKSILNAEAYSFSPVSIFQAFTSIWDMLPWKPFALDSDIPLSMIPSLEGCFTPEAAEFMRYQGTFFKLQSGSLFNTCRVVEDRYVQLLERLLVNFNQKVFAIGPFNPVEIIKVGNNAEQRGECLYWLDKQECDSVIFVSFGSSTTMTQEQIGELAEGLERCGQKFIWVLRNADTCAENEVTKPRGPKLPQGFEDRVRNRGIVVKDWAPQLEILSHPSTGGFMTHCGWNSCMESISMGVPMAAWPMHSDQPRNSILVTEVLKIGIMVRDWANRAELVRSNCIENTVRRLMISEEGEEMRKKAVELGEKVRGSVAKGSDLNTEMDSFVAHITR